MFPADCEKTQAPPDTRYFEMREKERQWAESHQAGCGQVTNERLLSDAEILAELFSYHPPNEVTLPRFQAINQAAKNFAEIVLQNCPRSADRSAAIRQIREARMTANAAISVNGLSL